MKKGFGKILTSVVLIAIAIVGVYLMYDGISGIVEKNKIGEQNQSADTVTDESPTRELQQGEVIEKGCYTVVDDVKIIFDGTEFLVENNNKNTVMVTCGVYGAKSDGTYQRIATLSFSGVDEEQYNKDKVENGWAIPQDTNRISSGETLKMSIGMGYISFGSTNDSVDSISDFDVDSDGYYDICFTVSRQTDEGYVMASTDDIHSDYFKLKIK